RSKRDWSSDVCSSDLPRFSSAVRRGRGGHGVVAGSPRATTRDAAVMLQAGAPLDGALWTPGSLSIQAGGGAPPKVPRRSEVERNRLNLVDVALVRRRGTPDRDPEDPGEES